MRGDVIYQVFGVHEGRNEDAYFGSFRTMAAAEVEVQRLQLANGGEWAEKYHNKGFEIRPLVVACEFEFPSLPKPRDKYLVKCSSVPNQPGTWDSTRVEVFRRGAGGTENQRICDYLRYYSMLQTFEPFRQQSREFALISCDYTKTAVLDLTSGTVIAEEGRDGSSEGGFCPVGFYVPDWWDVNDGSTLPGSRFWTADDEWPRGDFGFVWGCTWGDDSSWKVEYLDLSRIQEGIIRRDNRFGYVELATDGYASPCLKHDLDAAQKTKPPSFIRAGRYQGVATVSFDVEMEFDIQSGQSKEWKRQRIANFE